MFFKPRKMRGFLIFPRLRKFGMHLFMIKCAFVVHSCVYCNNAFLNQMNI